MPADMMVRTLPSTRCRFQNEGSASSDAECALSTSLQGIWSRSEIKYHVELTLTFSERIPTLMATDSLELRVTYMTI